MDGPSHQTIETNGIRLRVAIQGDGPLVLLCHGFPETSHSWRHQMPALAAAGYRAVAPDLRGYGESTRPDASDAYTQLHIAGDLVGLVDALKRNGMRWNRMRFHLIPFARSGDRYYTGHGGSG